VLYVFHTDNDSDSTFVCFQGLCLHSLKLVYESSGSVKELSVFGSNFFCEQVYRVLNGCRPVAFGSVECLFNQTQRDEFRHRVVEFGSLNSGFPRYLNDSAEAELEHCKIGFGFVLRQT
jgi:hypothetical protein